MDMPAGGEFWSNDSPNEVQKAVDESTKEPSKKGEEAEPNQDDMDRPVYLSGPQAKDTAEEAAETTKQKQQQIPEDKFGEVKGEVIRATPEPQHHGGLATQRPSICVVPGDLAEGNRSAYVPAVVCIGPFLETRRESGGMAKLERYKWWCVRRLVVGRGRGGGSWIPQVHEPLLRRCLSTMWSLLPRIRASYSISSTGTDTIADDSDDANAVRFLLDHLKDGEEEDINRDDWSGRLAQNMLLDGCFILHRLLKFARKARRGGGGGDDDEDWTQVYGRCWVWGLVTRDLLLLNNQIPFFVIQALLEHLRGPADIDDGDDVLLAGALHLFGSLQPCRLLRTPPPIASRQQAVQHLLHLFYLSITDLPSPPEPEPDHHQHAEPHQLLPSSELPRWVPSATELEDAGVTLRARDAGAAASFLDMSFRRGVLEIPALELYDYSEPLFRNLIAFEQTYPATPGHVTAYAIFMDCLVKTDRDLRLLHGAGILVNHMNGERDAASFFSRVCAEAHTSADRNYLAGLMADVLRYQSGRWPRWRAALVRDYFGNPWATIAVVVGAVVLVMTALQTFYTVYPYYNK